MQSMRGAVLTLRRDACVQHKPEVCQLIAELAAAGSEALGVALDAGVQERLCAYGRSGEGRAGAQHPPL